MGTNLLDEYFDNTESRYSDLDGQITEIVINDLKKAGQFHKYAPSVTLAPVHYR